MRVARLWQGEGYATRHVSAGEGGARLHPKQLSPELFRLHSLAWLIISTRTCVGPGGVWASYRRRLRRVSARRLSVPRPPSSQDALRAVQLAASWGEPGPWDGGALHVRTAARGVNGGECPVINTGTEDGGGGGGPLIDTPRGQVKWLGSSCRHTRNSDKCGGECVRNAGVCGAVFKGCPAHDVTTNVRRRRAGGEGVRCCSRGSGWSGEQLSACG